MTQRIRKRLHRDPNTKLDLEISVPRDSGVAVKR